ncbi:MULTISPECIES: JmjC domain-containing protein [unclassified Micromonospora]|uniref:JmjC domain-containing protein n=1 Tax=unclassified Micromonospora TaxID=2617518 RepID=UPI003319C51B
MAHTPGLNAPAVADALDWPTFVSAYWDRRPVLYRAVRDAPYGEVDTFRAAVRAADPSRGGPVLTPNVQFTVERVQRTAPGDHLPAAGDGSFDGYEQRLAGLLGGRRYALVAHCFHAFDFGLWSRQRSFWAPLWHHVGLPYVSAITTLFHGTYEHSPVGVHRDRYATFMFVLRGRKRMRFWPARPWSEPVTTVLDYDRYRSGSFAVEVGPGDLLYWPASYYHVGESAGDEPATSVNVGVPREVSGAVAVPDLFGDLDPLWVGDPAAGVDRLSPLPATPFAPGPGPDGRLPATLPAGLRQATARLRGFARDGGLRARTAALSVRFWTAAGFRPVPPPAPARPLHDDAWVRAVPGSPVLWSPAGSATVVGANGHTVWTAARPAAVERLLAPLADGRPARVGRLLAAGPDDGAGAATHDGSGGPAPDRSGAAAAGGSWAGAPDGSRPDAPLPATRAGTRRLVELLVSFRGLRAGASDDADGR